MKKRRRPQNAFSQASRNLSVRCVITSFKPRAGTRFPVGPVPGYRTRRKAHALPIVRDEFRPAIPRRVARQHCPSPLHRHHQLKIIAASKEMIYHRTVNSLLTVCLTHRDNSKQSLRLFAACARNREVPSETTERPWRSALRICRLSISGGAPGTSLFPIRNENRIPRSTTSGCSRM